jgi:hypothetical protein
VISFSLKGKMVIFAANSQLWGKGEKERRGVFLPLFDEKPPFASPFNEKALIRRKGAFSTRGGHAELFNQILIGRFSLPLFRRILEQSISIIKRQFDLIRLANTPTTAHVVKRRPSKEIKVKTI